MKILMVSMFSPHFFNWADQLKDSGHEIYWLDIYDSNTFVEKIDFAEQIIGWRYKWDYPGRYRIKKTFPLVDIFFRKINERNIQKIFKNKLEEIKPDVVHSFVMYSACVPILGVMKKYNRIKWIYSAWGNDLFFYQNNPEYRRGMINVFPYLHYMFADCKRDYLIAKSLGYSSKYLGTYPTGGGYHFDDYQAFINKKEDRNIILIKGYQHKFGRCNSVLDSLLKIYKKLENYKIVVFAANNEVTEFANKIKLYDFVNLQIIQRMEHEDVLKLMGESSIYIGNSISDGMPNTLLEAIIMEVFPIQSNPGGATAEIIDHGKNGLLINDPEDSDEIANIISTAIEDNLMRNNAIKFNNLNIKPNLDRELVKEKVLEKYRTVEEELNT
ncbi:MAG: glycosyltransferase family 4 protein [Zunongwangia sp.]|uniref:glycosyltransferase family 4 protein n=1 Tax=Zunongwangia sp. TaxID=1965325 RepID=UPI00324286C9